MPRVASTQFLVQPHILQVKLSGQKRIHCKRSCGGQRRTRRQSDGSGKGVAHIEGTTKGALPRGRKRRQSDKSGKGVAHIEGTTKGALPRGRRHAS